MGGAANNKVGSLWRGGNIIDFNSVTTKFDIDILLLLLLLLLLLYMQVALIIVNGIAFTKQRRIPRMPSCSTASTTTNYYTAKG